MLAVLKVGMVVINVDSFWQFVVTGIIIIVASYFEFISRILKDLFQDIKRQLSFKLQLKPQIAHSIAALIYFQSI